MRGMRAILYASFMHHFPDLLMILSAKSHIILPVPFLPFPLLLPVNPVSNPGLPVTKAIKGVIAIAITPFSLQNLVKVEYGGQPDSKMCGVMRLRVPRLCH